MNAPTAYRLENVVRSYGDAFSLCVPSLSIAAGESLCLVGPTGSGKSTLIRLLSGLDRADEGSIWHHEKPLNGRTPIEAIRRIALVPQKPLLFHGTLQKNVEIGLRLRGRATHDAADRMLDVLELRSLARQAASTLSGGQVQLAAIARALVLNPQVLLLDEPTANLDPARVALVEKLVAERRRESGMTVVWATHHLFQARRMADRVALVLGGQIIEVAPSHDFFERPADPRTAAFVQGTMVY